MDVLFVCDPPEAFSPAADSTVVMAHEAQRRGARVHCAMLEDLSLHNADAFARVVGLSVTEREGGFVAQRTGEAAWMRLSDYDVILMRKDPPFDSNYLTATWILDRAGTLVLNRPGGLRDWNEKLAIARFPSLTPATHVSRNVAELRQLLRELGGRMILKPVLGFGGREILLAREDDPNLGTLLELATADGTRWTIAQEYLPEARNGDKRILLVDGMPIGAVLRVPAAGELRNNFHAGGSPALSQLDENDQTICATVGPALRDAGQFFVGLDVIGGRLTEINVTSPTGMQEINRLHELQGDDTMQARFWAAIETKLGVSTRT